MASPARITSLPSGSVSVRLAGELDLGSAHALQQRFACALRMSPNLVIDLHEVTFLDAAVIATFIKAHHQASARGGSLVLSGPTPWVEDVLRAGRATEALPLLPEQRRNG